MPRTKLIAIILIGASIAGLAVAVPVMTKRLSGREIPLIWFDKPIGNEEFEFQGQHVAIRTVDPPAGAPPETLPTLEIRFRGRVQSFAIEPGQQEDPRLPGLLRHDDWLRALVMAEGARSEEELAQGLLAGRIKARLIIAMRRPDPEFNAETWGQVRRRDWRYRFVELLPAAPEAECIRVYEGTYGELDKLGNAADRRAAGREGDVWMFYAMQHVTPPTLFRSKNRPIDEAMSAMGWTWPAAGASIIGLVIGLGLLATSGLSRPE